MDKRQISHEFEWSKRVKDRDGHQCQMKKCNSKSKVEAHHIIPLSRFNELPKYNVRIMLGDIHNGRTLCAKCHKKEHEKGDEHINQLVVNYKLNKKRSIQKIIANKVGELTAINTKIKNYITESKSLATQISNLKCQI